MKFILFIEGPAEKALPAFLKKWLDPPRLSQPVGIKTVSFDGCGTFVKDAPTKTRMHLEGPEKDKIIAVIGLLDLYSLTFPANKKTTEERYDWAKSDLEKKVGHSKFFQFFAVHETEAWLLSDPNLFSNEIKKALPKTPPEKINFNKPPARLLNDLYEQKLGRTYKKVTHGRQLFSRLDPNIVYGRCPRFGEILDKMLELAKEAGM